MGHTQSVISTEDFKNYLYGTTVLMLSPRLDKDLQFKDCVLISDDDQHVLPLVLGQQQPKNIDEAIASYINYYGRGDKDEAIDRYVRSHILDSNEHIDAFLKALVGLLQERQARVDTSLKRLDQRTSRSVNTTRTQVPIPVHAPQMAHQDTKSQDAHAHAQTQTQTQAVTQSPVQLVTQTQTQAVTPDSQPQAHFQADVKGQDKLDRRLRQVQKISNDFNEDDYINVEPSMGRQ